MNDDIVHYRPEPMQLLSACGARGALFTRDRTEVTCVACTAATLRRVHIVSDGTAQGTHVMVDGVRLEGVTEVQWRVDWTGTASAIVTLDDVSVDVAATEERT